MSRKPRFLVYWMTTTSLSTLTSYTTTLTVASLTCTPSAFELSLCGWPRERAYICFGLLDSSHKTKFCLEKVFVATTQNYCSISEYVIAENHGILKISKLHWHYHFVTLHFLSMHRGMTENILSWICVFLDGCASLTGFIWKNLKKP